MNRSLAWRLTAMFAACGAAVFLVGGLLLHASLRSSLDHQVREELTLRATLLETLLEKAATPAQWHEKMVPKLDAAGSDSGGTRVWVASDDPGFRYGQAPPELEGKVRQGEGFGAVAIEGRCDVVTLVRRVPAWGERPPLRLILAKDPTPFEYTLRSFRLALVAIVLGGVAVVSLLGYWIARVGLRPVGRLSAQAQALSPADRAQRLGMQPMPAELSDLAASFNGALERLEAAYRQLEGFNADVAHELRTPLMNLIGQTQVVLSRPRPAGQLEEVLQSNLEELERLRAIVNDMLFLARADQGAVACNPTEISLAGEVLKVAEFLEPLMEEGRVRLEVEGDERVRIETALFRRAVSNLLHNAIQHSAAGQAIVVRIERRDGSPCLAVSNPGRAIEERHLVHLFDRFYRADAARHNSGESHGLGLAIVKAIATMHHGRVFARSAGGWNTFGFTLAAME